MYKRYQPTFDFFDTEEEARKFADVINRNYTYYMRKHRPAHYVPWESRDGTEHKFVVMYHI